jgi:tetratricopeptide (TPR) repeat protein
LIRLSFCRVLYKDSPHCDIANSLNKIGNTHNKKCEYDLALQFFKESLLMRKMIYKDSPHSDVANSLDNIGNAYYKKGKYDSALHFYNKSLKMRKMIYKDSPHRDVADSLNNIGFSHRQIRFSSAVLQRKPSDEENYLQKFSPSRCRRFFN